MDCRMRFNFARWVRRTFRATPAHPITRLRVEELEDRTNPGLLITTASLPEVTVGAAYAQTATATGGTGAITWSVASGALPAGLTLNPSTGAITGTPIAANFATLTQSFGGATVPQGSLLRDAAGDLFGTTGGGLGVFGTVFELPAGSNLPVTLVNFNLTIGVYPNAGLIADAAGDLFGTTSEGGPGGLGTVFELVHSGTVYTLTNLVNFNNTNGAYPQAGLIADAAGDLFGTTSAGGSLGDGTVFELVHSGGGYTLTNLVNFNSTNGASPQAGLIADAAGDLFGTTSVGGSVHGGDYGTVFELVHSGARYTLTTLVNFDLTDGADPVIGLRIDAAGDLFGSTSLGGSLDQGTVFELVNSGTGYTLTTLNNLSGTGPMIADAAGDLFGTAGGGSFNIGTVFELVHSGTVCTPITLVNFNTTNGGFPSGGLTADAAGDLFGTTAFGHNGTVFELSAAAFTLQATDATGATATTPLFVLVNPLPAIVTPALPGGTVGLSYAGAVRVTGGTAPLAFAITAGALPAGLSLDSTATFGGITGTPTATGSSTFTITVTDANGVTASQAYTVVINPTPSITTASLPNWTVGRSYNQAVRVTGGTAPLAFAITDGALPAGLNLNAATGAVTGTPTATGTSSFTVTVTDAAGASRVMQYSVTVNPTPTLIPTTLPNASVASPYSQTIATGGGTKPYSVLAVSNFSAGPTGLPASAATANLAAGTVTVSGTPTAAGTATFTVTLIDAAGVTVIRNYALVVGTPVLVVSSLVGTADGFVANFSRPIDPTQLNLYDTSPSTLGPADVTLTGPAGPVHGSLTVDSGLTQITFVATGGALAAGSYTVGLRSAANGFKDAAGGLLDGNGDGVTGDDYTGSFAVATSPVVLGLPDFVRGAGQPVNVPVNAPGLPLTISDASTVTGVTATVLFDPTLLSITGAAAGPNGGTVSLQPIPGGVQVTVTGMSGAAGTNVPVAYLTASVPLTAPYTSKELLSVTNVVLTTTGPALPAVGDESVHVAAFVGDVTGDQSYTPADVTVIQRLSLGVVPGLAAYPLVDPLLIADTNGDGAFNSADVTILQRAILGVNNPLPPLPSGAVTTGTDPRLYLSAPASVLPGQTVTVALRVDVTDPAGVTVNGGEFAIGFDPKVVRVSNVRTGSMLPGFTTGARSDAATGVVVIDQSGPATALGSGADGAVVLFDVTVRPGASGDVVLNLLADAGPARTELSRPTGELTLIPAPTNAPTDPGDADVLILPPVRSSRSAVGRAGPQELPSVGVTGPVRTVGDHEISSDGRGAWWLAPDVEDGPPASARRERR
jgi:hypothetical protein